MWNQRLMWTLWPAFLSACVLELVVFAFVDPQELHWAGQALALSRQTIYTVAFFVFWAVGVGTGFLATLLSLPAGQVNGCPVPPGERPEGCR